jgi:hypothetical protein
MFASSGCAICVGLYSLQAMWADPQHEIGAPQRLPTGLNTFVIPAKAVNQGKRTSKRPWLHAFAAMSGAGLTQPARIWLELFGALSILIAAANEILDSLRKPNCRPAKRLAARFKSRFVGLSPRLVPSEL